MKINHKTLFGVRVGFEIFPFCSRGLGREMGRRREKNNQYGSSTKYVFESKQKKVETTLPQWTYSVNYKIGVDDTHAF